MKKIFDYCLVVLVLVLLANESWSREIIDSTGFKQNIPASPKRIITLVPSLGELAAEILQADSGRIVGVSEYTDYPPSLRDVVSVGAYTRINIEKISSLKPDLVLATKDGNPKDQVLHLREIGIPVLVVSTLSLREVSDSIQLVSDALGFSTRGTYLVQRLQRGIDNIKKHSTNRPSRKILLQLDDNPLVVVGGGTFLNETLEVIGAKNAYGEKSLGNYPRPSLEDVMKRNPDVIVILALGTDAKPFQRMAAGWKRLPGIKAVKDNRVVIVDGDTVTRPTLRLLEGLSRLERAVYK